MHRGIFGAVRWTCIFNAGRSEWTRPGPATGDTRGLSTYLRVRCGGGGGATCVVTGRHETITNNILFNRFRSRQVFPYMFIFSFKLTVGTEVIGLNT